MAQEVIGKAPLREEIEQQKARLAKIDADLKRQAIRKVGNAIVEALLAIGDLREYNEYHDQSIFIHFVVNDRQYRVAIDDEPGSA